MVIFGSPTTGKSTFLRLAIEKGILAVDTDYPQTLFTIMGDSVPDQLRSVRSISSSAPQELKNIVKNRLVYLAEQTSVLIVTNFALDEDIYGISFIVSPDNLAERFLKRDPKAYDRKEMFRKAHKWYEAAINSSITKCEVIDVKQGHISDYSKLIFEKYKLSHPKP